MGTELPARCDTVLIEAQQKPAGDTYGFYLYQTVRL